MGKPTTPCREYNGVRHAFGYGMVNKGPWRAGHGYQQVLLHRWIVEQVEGRTLDADEIVMHECDNPPCFRYDHLRSRATQADNIADMDAKGRRRSNPRRGEDSTQAKLTEVEVREILPLHGTATSRIVGEAYGVSAATIRDIWLRRRWRHVDV